MSTYYFNTFDLPSVIFCYLSIVALDIVPNSSVAPLGVFYVPNFICGMEEQMLIDFVDSELQKNFVQDNTKG